LEAKVEGSAVKRWCKCTMFFHQKANSNRRDNYIEKLVVNGTISSYQSKIRDHIVQFYNRLFTKQHSWQPKLDGLTLDSIGEDRPFGGESF
jgi:hypothetical protein